MGLCGVCVCAPITLRSISLCQQAASILISLNSSFNHHFIQQRICYRLCLHTTSAKMSSSNPVMRTPPQAEYMPTSVLSTPQSTQSLPRSVFSTACSIFGTSPPHFHHRSESHHSGFSPSSAHPLESFNDPDTTLRGLSRSLSTASIPIFFVNHRHTAVDSVGLGLEVEPTSKALTPQASTSAPQGEFKTFVHSTYTPSPLWMALIAICVGILACFCYLNFHHSILCIFLPAEYTSGRRWSRPYLSSSSSCTTRSVIELMCN